MSWPTFPEMTSGMSLEGLAAESCLVKTLKETIESNILLFSKCSQKKFKTKYTKTTHTWAYKATSNLFYPSLKL